LSKWKAVDADELQKRFSEKRWQLQGNRPANHPRRRLEQYARLVTTVPNWPDRLAEILQSDDRAGEAEECARAYRRRLKLGALRKSITGEVWSDQVASPRADTLLIDGLLPLAAVHFDKPDLYTHWLHWWPGDLQNALKDFLRSAGMMTQDWPLSNGSQQVALQSLIEREG
tara:strand:- start:525 stop:1037 length:513 start_codon:yes stop_codon:yes gene_type:complete